MLGLPAALLFQLFVLIFWVAGKIPIPQLRPYINSSLLLLTGSVGDSLALDSPTRRAQIESKIRRDLYWLYDQGCEHIIVIAHSQGATVALHALRKEPPDSIDLLITFGSGIAKLEEIRQVTQRGSIFEMLGLAVPIVLSLTALAVFAPGVGALVGLLLLPGISIVALCVWFGTPVLTDHIVKCLFERDNSSGKSAFCRWFDCFSSKDPVPQGPIPHGNLPKERFKSRTVHNSASMIGDHTSYWQNRDEFVPAITDELAKVVFKGSNVRLRRNLDAHERCRARRFKVGWLWYCRVAILLTLAVSLGNFLVTNWQALPKIVGEARNTGSLNLAKLLSAALVASVHLIDGASLVYIGTVLALLLSGYLLATLGWHVWIHWSLPRVYENQMLEPAVLWRWLGFWTMVIFSFGSCWLVIWSVVGGFDLVSGSVSFATLIASLFGYFTVLVPPLAVFLVMGFGALLLRLWRKS
jgi:hypothetical protein